MYDNETGRFTTPDLLWSAFPAQTPYHYAYNSPMTYRDPSGLAPEKEKEGEELQVLFDWSSIQAGLLAVQRFVEEIQNSSKYNAGGVSYESLDPDYEGYGPFGRTAHQNWLNSDIWKRKYEALVALGIIRTYILDFDSSKG